MNLSGRSWSRLKRQHEGRRRTELRLKDQLALREFIELKSKQPGLTAKGLYKSVMDAWGLGIKAAKKHIAAAASAPPAQADLTRKEAKQVRAKGAGRKTVFGEALEACRKELVLEDSRGHDLDSQDLLWAFT
eukprot:916448-Lingulodinium_polyedra.AAC.1